MKGDAFAKKNLDYIQKIVSFKIELSLKLAQEENLKIIVKHPW